MAPWIKGLIAGVLVGIAVVLLVGRFTGDSESVPQELADTLGCPSPAPQTAAWAHHGPGYSRFSANHANLILGIGGCETGPATLYLRYGAAMDMSHVLATLHRFGAVCVVGHAIFDGKVLNGRPQLRELCAEVGGTLKILRPARRRPGDGPPQGG
ncbi:MAG: hypothetical protein WBM00_04090 [Solirubrobacterales bacterium]